MKEYIIKVADEKPDIMGNMPLVEKAKELVRCKDCEHGERCTNGAKLPAIQCFNSDNGEFGLCHEPDWFCADGERKGT